MYGAFSLWHNAMDSSVVVRITLPSFINYSQATVNFPQEESHEEVKPSGNVDRSCNYRYHCWRTGR